MTRLSTTARGAANQWAEKWLATFELVGAVTLLGALVFPWRRWFAWAFAASPS